MLFPLINLHFLEQTCSRGSACNFIHCFRNPGADYEWADWDKPAPRYWLKKMAALFGYTGDGFANEVSPGYVRFFLKIICDVKYISFQCYNLFA